MNIGLVVETSLSLLNRFDDESSWNVSCLQSIRNTVTCGKNINLKFVVCPLSHSTRIFLASCSLTRTSLLCLFIGRIVSWVFAVLSFVNLILASVKPSLRRKLKDSSSDASQTDSEESEEGNNSWMSRFFGLLFFVVVSFPFWISVSFYRLT